MAYFHSALAVSLQPVSANVRLKKRAVKHQQLATSWSAVQDCMHGHITTIIINNSTVHPGLTQEHEPAVCSMHTFLEPSTITAITSNAVKP